MVKSRQLKVERETLVEIGSQNFKVERSSESTRVRCRETTVVAEGWGQHFLPFFDCDPRSIIAALGPDSDRGAAARWQCCARLADLRLGGVPPQTRRAVLRADFPGE